MFFSSCKVLYPDLLFKDIDKQVKMRVDSTYIDSTGKVITFEVADSAFDYPSQYQIVPGDRIQIQVFSNDGYELVSVISAPVGNRQQAGTVNFLVKNNGFVRLPLIDSVNVEGMTVEQAERMLEDLYETYFNEPFVIINVTNRRVMVYMGRATARLIPLENENTTLIEVLAIVGGLNGEARAFSVKLIRGDLKDPHITNIDLSTVEGLKKADLIVRANDIIYIEPALKITTGILLELGPILSLATSLLLVFDIVSRSRNLTP